MRVPSSEEIGAMGGSGEFDIPVKRDAYGSADHAGTIVALQPGQWIRVKSKVKLHTAPNFFRGFLDTLGVPSLSLCAVPDLDLLGIEPFTLTVHLNPEVSRGEYQRLHGCALSCSEGNRPSQEALLIRWEAFKKRDHIS
jgi:hypothetical protein